MIPRVLDEEGAYVLEGEYEISCSDSHTVLDSYKTTVDRDIYDESNDGKRSSDKRQL
ncbi:MAG: hypothetical protein ACLVB1_11865 [Blautia obeum]